MVNTALFMTVGTGSGGKEATDSLAHGLMSFIKDKAPDLTVFFGSSISIKTVESIKEQWDENYELNYEFVEVNEVESFNDYYLAFKSKISEYENDYKIFINYTSGTKTMSISAALTAMIYKKTLHVTGGHRINGTVSKGTEEHKTQNLYLVYDDLMINKVRELFNEHRFESGKLLLKDITGDYPYKDIYLKLFEIYMCFDSVNYSRAFEYFTLETLNEFCDYFPELTDQFRENRMALQRIAENNKKFGDYYIIADLLNNSRRRFDEGKYDDAIARLYRCFELIAQTRLEKKYKIDSSNVDTEILKNRNLDEEYIKKLENIRHPRDNRIKIGLEQDYMLLNNLNDSLGNYFKENEGIIHNCTEYRNHSILAHGLNHQTEDNYMKFEKIVLDASEILNSEISEMRNKCEFPKL